MPIELIAYGVVMAGLGTAVARFCPELARYAYGIAVLASLFGLCLGLLGLSGRNYRKFTWLTLLGITLLTVVLNLAAWNSFDSADSSSRLAVLTSSLMVFFSMGLFVMHSKTKVTSNRQKIGE